MSFHPSLENFARASTATGFHPTAPRSTAAFLVLRPIRQWQSWNRLFLAALAIVEPPLDGFQRLARLMPKQKSADTDVLIQVRPMNPKCTDFEVVSLSRGSVKQARVPRQWD